jgi:hypothetical protein
MMLLYYHSKKALKESIGKSLKYEETSFHGPEFKPNGDFTGSNRPSLTGIRTPKGGKAREFFARITMVDGKIASVK